MLNSDKHNHDPTRKFFLEITRRDLSTKLLEIVDRLDLEFPTVEAAKTCGDELLRSRKYLCEADGYRVIDLRSVIDVTYRADPS